MSIGVIDDMPVINPAQKFSTSDFSEFASEANVTYDTDVPDEVLKEKYGEYEVVYPEPNQLLLDLDTDEQYESFQKRIARLFDTNKLNIKAAPSASGLPHRHITVTFPTTVQFTNMERIAIQAVLGSDIIREFFSVRRVLQGVATPTKFFEKASTGYYGDERPLKL